MIDAGTRGLVRQRAGNRCEDCQLQQEHSPLAALQIEHVVPKKHRGADDPENLALACIDCNLAKASNIAGLDPATSELTQLFHPRRDRWSDHFEWQACRVVGKTAIGRTTVYVLDLNADERVELRLLTGICEPPHQHRA